MNLSVSSEKASMFSADDEIEIDRRSFHVFEMHGDRLLFDRATGTTCELNDLAFEALKSLREGNSLSSTLSALGNRYGELDLQDVRATLGELKRHGFFQFEPVKPAEDAAFESLWNHRPRRLQLLMAEGCNLGCRYCYQWRNGTNQKRTLMPWSIARNSVDYLIWRSGGRNDLQITFFGGEPLLNYPMIQRVVEYCRALETVTKKRFTFELITNGTLLTKNVVDFLVKHRFLLFISLDGFREMHEYNRPALDGNGSYDAIVSNAVYANEQYVKHDLTPIKIRANLTNRHHDTQKVEEAFQNLGFRLMGIGAVEPLPHGDPSPAALTEDQMDKISDDAIERLRRIVGKLAKGIRPSPVEQRVLGGARGSLEKVGTLGITCGVCRNTTVVDNRGNMYPCHRYGEMQEYIIGNIVTGMDRELVMNYYRKINRHSTTECHDCWIRDYCGGGCAWLLSDKEGKIHHPTPRECARRRRGMEGKLWLRKELRRHSPDRIQDDDGLWDRWDWDARREMPAVTPTSRSRSDLSLPVLQSTSPNGSCGSSCGDNGDGACSQCSSHGPEGQLVQILPITAGKMA